MCRISNRECDACGECGEGKPVLHAYNGEPIYEGEEYYCIEDEIICLDDLADWAESRICIAMGGQP
jgi:hypothetical protein